MYAGDHHETGHRDFEYGEISNPSTLMFKERQDSDLRNARIYILGSPTFTFLSPLWTIHFILFRSSTLTQDRSLKTELLEKFQKRLRIF